MWKKLFGKKEASTNDPNGVSLTPAAARRIKEIRRDTGVGNVGRLRVSVKSDPSTGAFTYDMNFSEGSNPRVDHLFVCDGVKMAVDMISMKYLKGTVIDFESNGGERTGFRFHNPRAMEA